MFTRLCAGRGLSVCLLVLLTACGGDTNTDNKPPSSNADQHKAGFGEWTAQCDTCHGAAGNGTDVPNSKITIDKYKNKRSSLIQVIVDTMPKGNPAACGQQCAESVADFMLAGYPVESTNLSRCKDNNVDNHSNSPIRLLTTSQYKNIVEQVYAPINLNLSEHVPAGLLIDALVGGFKNNAGVTLDSGVMQKLIDIIEPVSAEIADNFDQLVNCQLSDSCVRSYIEKYGYLLFRDTPSIERINELLEIYSSADNDKDGIAHLTTAMLLSPMTLYQYENQTDNRSQLSGPQLASKLSFFLWNSGPDKILLDAATNGQLNTAEGIATQTERMLSDGRALKGLEHFYANLTSFDYKHDVSKNGQTISAQQLIDELVLFTSYWTREEAGTFSDLILSRKAFVNEDSAALYGLANSALNNANHYLNASEVELDSSQRAGLLTRLAYVLHGSGDQEGLASPTIRGEHFRNQIMCQTLPDAPGDVEFPPTPDPKEKTWVEVVKEIHLADIGSSCEVCHRTMDPIGFGFEHYTNSGGYIANYPNGKVVDASGVFHKINFQETDIDGQTFNNAVDMSEIIAGSESAKACFAEKWLNNALSRETDNDQDICALEQVIDEFEKSNYSLKELILAIVKNPSFRYRNPE